MAATSARHQPLPCPGCGYDLGATPISRPCPECGLQRFAFHAGSATVTDSGLLLRTTDGLEYPLLWSSVREVRIYKYDLWSFDDIALLFTLQDGSLIEISEELVQGYSAVATAASGRFAFPADWFSSIAVPAFARNERILWSAAPSAAG